MKAIEELVRSIARLAAASYISMLLMGALHSTIPAVPALGWWSCIMALTLASTVVGYLTFSVTSALKAEGEK